MLAYKLVPGNCVNACLRCFGFNQTFNSSAFIYTSRQAQFLYIVYVCVELAEVLPVCAVIYIRKRHLFCGGPLLCVMMAHCGTP